jgi:EmrB/QacA subfamily drug resistance transporter
VRAVDRRTLVLVATILGSSLAFLDAFIVSLALPTIREKLHFGFAGQQWVAISYSLALVSLYLIAGALGDRLGRRRVFLAAIVAFALTSAGAGLAQNASELIAARVGQGIAAAFVSTNSLALIRALYKEESGRAIGIWTAATALATIAGPPLGGLLVQSASWCFIFFINIPLGAIAIVCTLLGAREDVRTGPARRFDLVGAALIASTLGLLTLGLERAQTHSVGGVWWAFVGSALLFAGFVAWELRQEEPLLPLQLFRERTFAAANLETLLVYGALQSAGFYMPLYLQWLRLKPSTAGLVFIPTSLALAAFSGRVGRYADEHGPRMPLTVGPLLLAAGYGTFATVQTHGEVWTRGAIGVALFSAGLVLVVAPITAAALSAAPDRFAGVASGVNTTVSRLGGLVSVAVVGLVITLVVNADAGKGTIAFDRNDHSARATHAFRHAFESGVGVAAALALAGAAVGFLAIRKPVRAG